MKEIHLWGVKQNNLKNIEVKIPVGQMTVICGPSGSGKSSLAFETLFAEGQRRFIESMSNYARQFLNKAPKPNIEGINNIPPAISIEQKNTVKNSRSTVGTTTEVIDYLRLLFEKIGQSYCPTHNVPTEKQSVSEATDSVIKNFNGERGYILTEISTENRVTEGKKLLALLLQDGYLRIYVPKAGLKNDSSEIGSAKNEMGTIIDYSSSQQIKKGLPKDTFYLVIDRLSFNADEKGRLADSLTQAYEASIKYNKNVILRRATVITTDAKILKLSEENSCPHCNHIAPEINSKIFSFNSPIGACPTCKGFGNTLELDEKKIIPNPLLSLSQGAIHPFTMPSASHERKQLVSFCKKMKIDLQAPWKNLPQKHKAMIWNGHENFFGVKGLFEYLEEIKYKMHVRVFIARYRSPSKCLTCEGSRLRTEVNHILVFGKNIHQLSQMTIEEMARFFSEIQLTKHQEKLAEEIFRQIRSRVDFLLRVGVHYLTLSRETRTLSGGEYQRLNLANQLGMGLSQTLYVLDEPTVGLHPRDNDRLISILKDLKNLGNTLVIVEHDKDVIRSSENMIEMGPGSGLHGGEVVFSGSREKFLEDKQSLTSQYLRKKLSAHDHKETRPVVDIDSYKYKITLKSASGNNLKNIDVRFPLNRLVCVTGVSGSGKSTLVTKTLYPALARALEIEFLPTHLFKKIEGAEFIKNVLLIDQSSIGKSARSSPVTYMKAYDHIRAIMASTPEAKTRGYTAGTFSLNVDGGRCPACRGTGFEEIDMMFMDNVIIPCDVCDSKKFRPEILEIQYRGKNIFDILSMTVSEAMGFFVAHPNIRKTLSLLKEVGLDYIQLGQPANSLSGGESQRLKIARELSEVQQKNTLYILDEPTTGLHFREIELLMNVLHKLIDNGGSVIVVEHNLDVVSGSDYIIDLGPEGGKMGGHVVALGSPQEIVNTKESLTGQYLKREFGDKRT